MRALPLLILLAAPALAKPAAEAKGLEKVAKVWVDYARWCKLQGLKAEAEHALAAAREADAGADGLDALADEVAAMADGATEAPGLETRRKKARQDAAKHYDRLAKLDHADEDAPRFEGYLFRAAELDPSKSRLAKIAARVKQLAGNRRTSDDASRLFVRLRELDPEGKYDALEIDLAKEDVVLVKHPDHPMVGYLSLPKGWRKGAAMPVLVAVDGAGSNFLGAARNFAKARGGRDFLVLAPCSLSNTNALDAAKYPFYDAATLQEGDRDRIRFDVEGLKGLLAVLQERFGASERFGITGFSGGGYLCYAMTVLFPDRVLFSAPACANFSGMGFRDANPVEGGGPAISIFTGEKDPHRDFTHGNQAMPGIEPQTDSAVKALESLGFTNVKRTMLPGVGHSSCAQQVWDAADAASK